MPSTKHCFSAAPVWRLALHLAAPVTVCAAMFVATPASAAGLTGPISGWASGNVPSTVSMYEYVPAKLAPNAPVMVFLHACGGATRGGDWGEGAGLAAAADMYGFPIVAPRTSNNCWDCGSTTAMTHNAGGDTLAIVQQVNYAITKHGANKNRVYVTGTSSGAMMTEALLAVYPEVFRAGSEFAGVPAGCWGVSDSNGQWSGPCAGGTVTHTGPEWATMVQMMDPGFTGFRPRIQLWHGDADKTIDYKNQTEAVKEWTAVLGLSNNPTSTQTVTIDGHQYTHEQWQRSCGYTALDAWTEIMGPHGTDANFDATYVIPFLALDKSGDIDPEVAQCAGDGGLPSGGSSSGSSSSSGGVGGADASMPSGSSSGSVTGSSSGSNGGSSSGSVVGSSAGGNTGSSGSNGASSGGENGQTSSSGAATDSGSSSNNSSGASGGSTPYRPGGCDVARAPGGDSGFAWAGIAALGLVLGRRRRA